MPAEIGTLHLDLIGDAGADQVTVRHHAGSFSDVSIAADLGSGADSFITEFTPPLDNDMPAPGISV